MKKIILSSSLLHKILYEFLTPLILQNDEYEVKIECYNKKLQFAEFERKLDVESKSDWTVEIRIENLRKLFRLLKTISDQPLVISFENSSGWIQIDNFCI